jgi:hypothetical protein
LFLAKNKLALLGPHHLDERHTAIRSVASIASSPAKNRLASSVRIVSSCTFRQSRESLISSRAKLKRSQSQHTMAAQRNFTTRLIETTMLFQGLIIGGLASVFLVVLAGRAIFDACQGPADSGWIALFKDAVVALGLVGIGREGLGGVNV